MNLWVKSNGFSIAIALVGIIGTYSVNTALYGYRLGAVESRLDRQGSAIVALQQGDTTTQVALAKIQTDIEYIKVQLSALVQQGKTN